MPVDGCLLESRSKSTCQEPTRLLYGRPSLPLLSALQADPSECSCKVLWFCRMEGRCMTAHTCARKKHQWQVFVLKMTVAQRQRQDVFSLMPCLLAMLHISEVKEHEPEHTHVYDMCMSCV